MLILVRAYPFAYTSGTLEVPDQTENIQEYIVEHFNDVKFTEPELDYCGTDFEWDEMEAHA